MTTIARLRRRTIARARRGAVALARTRLGQRVRRPSISVIVPFYNVEKYFGDCLESIAVQTTGDFEVIMVDDGSPDGSRAVAEDYAARDPRFRLVTRPNGGLGAARNTGVRHARGRFLTFVDSDDLLPENALAALRESARRTGADMVVGSVERFNSRNSWQPEWVPAVHSRRREGIHLQEFLPLLRNLYTWNKLYRRDFWMAQGLEFREGVSYEDQPIVTELLLRARTVDVIPDVVYRYRIRDDQSSISQQTATLKDLRDRISAWRATEVALREAPVAVREGWLHTLFNAHFHWYLLSEGTEDDEYWSLIRSAVVDLTRDAPQAMWDQAMPQRRVMLELARQDRREDLHSFIDQEGNDIRSAPAEVVEDGVLVRLPFCGDPDLPDDLFVLRHRQLDLVHLVDSLAWTAAGLSVRGWAYLRKLDLARYQSHVDVVLRDTDTGTEQVFAAQVGAAVTSPMPAQDNFCDYAPGTFEGTVPMSAFVGASATWDIELRVSVAGLVVQRAVSKLYRAGSCGAMEPTWEGAGRLHLRWRYREPVQVVRETAGLQIVDLACTDDTVTGALAGPGADTVRVVEAVAGRRIVEARTSRRNNQVVFELTLPHPTGPRAKRWDLLAWRSGAATPQPLELPDLDEAVGNAAPLARLQPGRTVAGFAQVLSSSAGAEAITARYSPEGGLEITGRVFAPGAASLRLVTESVKSTSSSAWVPISDGRFEAALDLRHELFRFGRLPLEWGGHLLYAEIHDSDEKPLGRVRVEISTQLNRSLPIPVLGPEFEGALVRGPKGAAYLNLVRPVRELGSRRAQTIAAQVLAKPGRRATRRGLLVRAYFGERATDSGLGIQAELQRRGSDLPVYWAVQDHSVPVPDGGIPVIVNSAEWFDLAGSATYYLDNMYQAEYHYKPEGQVLIQTFHGYPFKQMGLPHWQHQGFPRAQIASYGRRSAEWDYLVSPAPYATPLLTRDFGYDGEVLEIGYPRNDILQSAAAPHLREQVRASLGIADEQVAVLYAPTFRDYLAQGNNVAELADLFDLEAVHRAFGEDVVVLMRGHAFNARAATRIAALPGVVDLTDYPEINDLYLAADVGVVDYSSLRFDFAITGKPMIFLVPDLERYVEARGWLFDFDPTAPGPQVATTDEVIEQLRDLPAMAAKYAAAYARFRADYLPLEDGKASARFVDAVMVPRGDA